MSMSNAAYVNSLVEDKADPELGAKVRAHLLDLGLEPAITGHYDPRAAFVALDNGIYSAYKFLGLDVDNDPSLKDTPKRFAKMFVGELTRGLNYDFFPKCTATPNGNVLAHPNPASGHWASGAQQTETVDKVVGAYDEMVLVKQIRITTLCEHHLQTIEGVAHIAYLPGTKVIGLSKLARVAEFFAARPQIQERMTEQVYHALAYILETEDVAVVIDATHNCMGARGVKQPNARTQTNKVGGRFLTKEALRKEFLDAI